MATITATGTWPDATTPVKLDVKGRYVGGSGVEFRNMGDDDFDSRASIARGKNLFDETQQFVALCAANMSMHPSAVIDQLLKILADMRRNPSMGERVFAP
jgi:hypothetical protein